MVANEIPKPETIPKSNDGVITTMNNTAMSGVQMTLLMPLMSRARITKQHPFLLNDPKAIELVELLSGPLPDKSDAKIIHADLGNAVRARNFDDEIKAFIAVHPKATIVNLGSGFDTTFSRIDNGEVTWFDIDFPEVMELRRLIIPETIRSRCVASSILDKLWVREVREIGPVENGVLFIAGGVLPYLSKSDVTQLFSLLADNFPNAEFVFDAVSMLGKTLSNNAIKKAGISSTRMQWAIGRNANLRKLDKRVAVQNRYSMFANIKRTPDFEKGMIRIMDRCDAWWNMSVVHCNFLGARH